MDGACRAGNAHLGGTRREVDDALAAADRFLAHAVLPVVPAAATGLGQALRGSTVSTRAMKACSSVM